MGDVRGGKGLLCGVELVKDREARERFPKEAELGRKLNRAFEKHGLLGRAGDVISLAPPLCITKGEVDYLVEQVNEIIGEVERELYQAR